MKPLDELIPIWLLNTPPRRKFENDYLLKIETMTLADKDIHFFTAIQWCPFDKTYYAEPVDIKSDGTLFTIEIPFTDDGLIQFRLDMAKMGIKSLRGFVRHRSSKDLEKQLASIHPALVPRS